jgi:uncharacterized protein YciI
LYYAIIARDRADSLAARLAARPAHLLVAGPHPAIDSEAPGPAGFSGSLVIAEFGDQGAAQAWAGDDPYIAAGVYDEVIVKPFIKVFPA